MSDTTPPQMPHRRTDDLPPLHRRADDYPRDRWSVFGYILVHPRTWILLLAFVVAWRCYGLANWWHGSNAIESAASAHEHNINETPRKEGSK